MLKPFLATFFVGLTALAVSVFAQDWEPPQPTDQHQFLKKFVGQWTMQSKMTMSPDDTMTCEGTMSSAMLGDFWIINKSKGEYAGQKMTSIQTIGYDSKKEKFVGTWVDSATDHMWHYEGELEKDGTKLSLGAKGPNFFEPGEETDFIDSFEFVSDDFVKVESLMKNSQGEWIKFGVGEMKRQK